MVSTRTRGVVWHVDVDLFDCFDCLNVWFWSECALKDVSCRLGMER